MSNIYKQYGLIIEFLVLNKNFKIISMGKVFDRDPMWSYNEYIK